MKKDTKEIENARAKMIDKLNALKKIQEQAEKEAFDAEFEFQILVRKGNIEESFWRFPHIGEKIFDILDNKTIVKCQKVNKW